MLWAVIFTGLRDATLNYFLLPAATALGIRKKKKQVRFAEQAWLLIYYCVLWSLGMVSPLSSAGVEPLTALADRDGNSTLSVNSRTLPTSPTSGATFRSDTCRRCSSTTT